MTTTQFMQKGGDSPHLVNDIVFNGTFASYQDYQHCSNIINSLPKVHRIGIVNAHPNLLTLNMNIKFRVMDFAIRSCNMVSVPGNLVVGLTQLYSLDLSNNLLQSLESITPFIQHSFKLQSVILSRNKLSAFPRLLTTLPNLTDLDLSCNHLATLEANDFQHLAKLRNLNISYNSLITRIPRDISDLPYLQNLTVVGLLSLKKPSYELARKGLPAIRKYYLATGWLMSGRTTPFSKLTSRQTFRQ